MPQDPDAALNQTIGSLNAKADQASRDIGDLRAQHGKDSGELRAGQRSIENQLGAMPDKILAMIEERLGGRLEKIEQRLGNVETTVNRWKGVIAFLAFGAAGIGWLLSHLSLKKIFGADS